jgi:rhodanese-related sulfurtransferase
MQRIDRQRVEKAISAGRKVAIIEALSEESFRKFHLPGAINVPVDDSRFEEKMAQAVPDKTTPVIVYCFDEECNASPRAAKRLEQLGYETVYDYEAGKMDWKEAGNPIES